MNTSNLFTLSKAKPANSSILKGGTVRSPLPSFLPPLKLRMFLITSHCGLIQWKELNAAAPGLKKPRLLFSWLLLEHSPLVPDELGGARMTFLASAFNSLGSPRSQPWHLVLASSPGLLSLGEVAWQRHPTWEKMTKESLREKGRK